MNIDQYRAMVAAEAEAAQEQSSTPDTTTQETVEETNQETTETQESASSSPSKVVVDDVEYDVDTIRALREGSLRQDDYTRKTQELARQKRELEEAAELFNHLQSNPKVLEILQNSEDLSPEDIAKLKALDPNVLQAQRTQRELNDLRLQNEIRLLTDKYDDFNTMQVLQVAYDRQLQNLEDAYKIVKAESLAANPPSTKETAPVIDEAKIRAELRASILAEIEAERASTQTLITSNGGKPPAQEADLQVSPEQLAVFRKQGLSDDDIKKWYTPKRK